MSINKLETMFKCKYCGKEFRKESSLSVHLCEPKRRWQQEKDTGVQLGLRSWLRFYELTQGSAQTKSYANFVESPYYSAFVKFGQYMVQIRAVNPAMFIDYIIKSNKKLDHWTKDVNYEEYLYDYLRKEHPTDALERSLLEMQKWADEADKSFNDYFRSAGAGKLVVAISNGRISPWVVFNCDSGIEALERLNEEQIKIIYRYIDPEYWQNKFKNYVVDVELIKSACSMAGL